MIQKTIIANSGNGGQGKSETAILLYNELITTHGSTINRTLYTPILPPNQDVSVILNLNNSLVGIEGQGDPNSRMFRTLNQLAQNNCDVIFCNARTRGATIREINRIARGFQYRLIWVTNDRSDHIANTILNQRSANRFAHLVLDVLSGVV